MKIAVMGYSGSGKSTLAQTLGRYYHIPVLHLDSVHFLPDWQEREPGDEQQIVQDYLNVQSDWVIDGNYTKLSYERRLESADQIVLLLFGRLRCLYRAYRRYLVFRGKSRPDIAEGCPEKMDWTFARWILRDGRRKPARERYRRIRETYREKTVVLTSQRQLDKFVRNLSNR